MNFSVPQKRQYSPILCILACCLVGSGLLVSTASSSTQRVNRPLLRGALTLEKRTKLSPRLSTLGQKTVNRSSLKAQARAVGLPISGPGSLLRAQNSRQLVVYVRPSGSITDATRAVRAMGAKVINISRRFDTITVLIDTGSLEQLGKLKSISTAREAIAPATQAICPSGTYVSEGDHQMGADTARNTASVTGQGITVGILSDSYNYLAGAPTGVANGELPGAGNPCGFTNPVSISQDYTSPSSDEGRAMVEAVHDLAPGATAAFATAEYGQLNMASNIRHLQSAGARVIADDITYYDEPMFQEGPIDVAVDDVTQAGATYFSSAGNENVVVGGQNIGSYEAPAYRGTPCPAGFSSYLDCHNFTTTSGKDATSTYTISNGGYIAVDLQWAQPWYGVTTDLDIYLINQAGSVLARSIYNSISVGEPYELLSYTNSTGVAQNVSVVIGRYSGAALPRLKYVLVRGAGITYAEYATGAGGDIVGPTIFGHNGGSHTISMAAVRYTDPETPEYYSSHGPVTYYFGPVSGTTPAAALASPSVLQKPDLAATDCGQNSFFGSLWSGVWHFCGTSQAAPHAAAVAALMLQQNPTLTPAALLAKLRATATSVTNGGSPDVVGAGLINAALAVGGAQVSFSGANYSASEASGQAAISLTRIGDTSAPSSVTVSTADGTALAGTDYIATSTTLSFAAGQSTALVQIPITDTHITGGQKTLTLTLSGPSAGTSVTSPATATLAILLDDRGVSFSSAAYSISEHGRSISISLSRQGNINAADTVFFATSDITGRAGRDYSATSKNVTFAAGQAVALVSIPIVDVYKVGGSRTVRLIMTTPFPGVALVDPITAILTIQDNDRPSGRVSTIKLTKKSFSVRRSGKTQVSYRFAPPSQTFAYVLYKKQGSKWKVVRHLKRRGLYLGTYKKTVKQFFGSGACRPGYYKLRISADKNSRSVTFHIA